MRRSRTARLPARRAGTTLTEVLMSLLVMGIGVVSVATLFPLSVLKSVRATQGTTATTLRYNAEALIDGSGTDPIYDGSGNVLFPGCATAAIAIDPDGNRDPVSNDTNYVGGLYVYDNSDGHRDGYYVVDPLGYWRLRQQTEGHDDARFFGSWLGVDADPFGPFGLKTNRFSLNAPDDLANGQAPYFDFTGTTGFGTAPAVIEENTQAAQRVTSLPDSFVNAADGRRSEAAVTIAADGGSVTFASGAADLSMFMTGPTTEDPVMLERGRVTVFSIDGRRSIVREMADPSVWTNAGTDLSNGRIQFKTPLPTGFAADADRVTVDSIEDRYSWMLTVRNRSEQGARKAFIDVVVFFRRPFGRQDERVYFVGQSFGDVAAFNRRKKELKEYFVAWNQTVAPIDPRPEIDEGDWMFDPVNFRWHKIGQVGDEGDLTPAEIAAMRIPTGVTPPNRKIVVRLEGAQVADEVVQRGIFMQGVVDVFPLRPKTSD